MKISIVSTFYNDKKMLALLLESVLNQTYSDIEFIVEDAGSSDGSVELLQEYEEKFQKVNKKLVWKSERDSGIYEGSNKAASMATGDYLIFASDPYVDNSTIMHLVKVLQEKHPDYVYGGMYFQRNGKIVRCWSGKPGNWKLGWMAATPTLCIKMSVWKKYGPFDTNYKSASDYKFQLALFQDKSLKSFPLNRVMVVYYAGGTSNGGFKAKWLSIKECQKILREYGVRFGWFTNLCKTLTAVFAYLFASHKRVIEREREA